MDISQRVLDLMDELYSVPKYWFEQDWLLLKGPFLPGWLPMYAEKLYDWRVGKDADKIDKLDAFLECKVPAYLGEAVKLVGYCMLAQYIFESLAK